MKFHFVSFYNCALNLAYQNVTNYSLIGVSDLLQAVAGGHLLKLPFGTIFEYLQVSLVDVSKL